MLVFSSLFSMALWANGGEGGSSPRFQDRFCHPGSFHLIAAAHCTNKKRTNTNMNTNTNAQLQAPFISYAEKLKQNTMIWLTVFIDFSQFFQLFHIFSGILNFFKVSIIYSTFIDFSQLVSDFLKHSAFLNMSTLVIVFLNLYQLFSCFLCILYFGLKERPC